MNRLELAAYSYWQHARRARLAIAATDVEATADAVGMIVQIGRYPKAASLVRCCASTEQALRRAAVRRFGRVSYYTSQRQVDRIVARTTTSPFTPPTPPLGAA